MKQVQKSEP